MTTASPKLPRKLHGKIDGREVLVIELVNDDLDKIDELIDEYSELERQRAELAQKINDCDDQDERLQLRAKARELTREMRVLDTRMLGLYVEDKDGNRFDDDVLAKAPVRVQTELIKQATSKVYGDDEGPTPGTSAG